MDEWQKSIYETCRRLVAEAGPKGIPDRIPAAIAFTAPEAYVVMKALEDQEKFTHPILEVVE